MASIRARPRKDGSVSHAVLWRDPGTGAQTSMTFSTRQEAKNFVRILTEHALNLTDAERTLRAILRGAPLITDLIKRHLDQLAGVTARTLADYESRARQHIKPHLGAVPVESLTRTHLTQWQRTLSAGGLSARSVGEVHSLLSAALSTGVELGWCPENVARGLKLTREGEHTSKRPRFLTAAEFARLLAALPEYYRPIVRALAGTGLRWGEVTGLNVGDLRTDQTPATVNVNKAMRRTASNWTLGPTKTRAGRRVVSLPDDIRDELAELAHGRPADAPLFTGPTGKGRVYHRNFWERVWSPSIKSADLAGLRIHDLRHTHASWLIQQGVPLTVIQRRLGHESIKTTSDTYGHLAGDAGLVAAMAAARAMAVPTA